MKSRKEDTAMLKKWLRPVGIGALVGALCCLLVLLIMAAVMAAKDIPKAAVTPMAIAAAALGALVGGFVSAGIARERGLLFGAACGLLLYLLVLLAGLSFLKDVRGSLAAVKLAVMVGCGAIGGVLRVNMKKR